MESRIGRQHHYCFNFIDGLVAVAALGCSDVSFIRGFLRLKMQMPDKKCSKIKPLRQVFNVAAAFSSTKYTRKSNNQETLSLLLCNQMKEKS
ncbi:hypothetical protein LVJ83_10440 [Uruburuella testudinis]|uniref:DDE family transposase n=1 Tax=Uruburuella testudinis TaxID=1282863 RepID=A0ABY4DSH6_9NEIS|nr:hypothetical protein [Uruburuella testudinis]UOO81373.1 hypothetical protein LVJ83_10440 [Uruburuella testudinis]